MISIEHAKRYCCEDVSKIENYDKALADEDRTWNIHHRAEVLPCGRYSIKELKKFGLYWKQPASRLIFLPPDEHSRLHGNNMTDAQKRHISEGMKGHQHVLGKRWKLDAAACARRSLQKMGNTNVRGYHWWNNGVKEVRAKEQPAGFTRGRLKP